MKSLSALLLLFLSAIVQSQQPATSESFVTERKQKGPIYEVWKTWSTSEGWKSLGVALADVDFRLGGLIRTRYGGDGSLGDAETIENEILAFEPPRMIAFRIHKTPASFPFKEAWKQTWTVLTLTPLPDGRTHARAASLGYGKDPESIAMREFFERGNARTFDILAANLERRAAK
jgi:uncharacterized protein YndB with AHSA1/START domain